MAKMLAWAGKPRKACPPGRDAFSVFLSNLAHKMAGAGGILEGDVDVLIVGGSLEGLSTAIFIKQAYPQLRVAIIEKHYCGYGINMKVSSYFSSHVSPLLVMYLYYEELICPFLSDIG